MAYSCGLTTPDHDLIEGERFERLAERGCYLCGSENSPRRIPVQFGMYASVAECTDCRLAYQSPLPAPEASIAYMNWRWRSRDSYVADPESQLKRARNQLAHVRRFFSQPGRLLDFGAGSGSFVKAAADEGWTATGLEQSVSARERAKRNFDVELLETLPHGMQFDAVTLWDVVEHLRDPRAVLESLRPHLSEDGFVFLETGNWESWRRLVEKDHWGLYLFDHQYYFSPASLRQVLADAGFGDFTLLDVNRERPTVSVRGLRSVARSLKYGLYWLRGRVKWPAHSEMNVMVAAARPASGFSVF